MNQNIESMDARNILSNFMGVIYWVWQLVDWLRGQPSWNGILWTQPSVNCFWLIHTDGAKLRVRKLLRYFIFPDYFEWFYDRIANNRMSWNNSKIFKRRSSKIYILFESGDFIPILYKYKGLPHIKFYEVKSSLNQKTI